jgi:hypothetical protein
MINLRDAKERAREEPKRKFSPYSMLKLLNADEEYKKIVFIIWKIIHLIQFYYTINFVKLTVWTTSVPHTTNLCIIKHTLTGPLLSISCVKSTIFYHHVHNKGKWLFESVPSARYPTAIYSLIARL